MERQRLSLTQNEVYVRLRSLSSPQELRSISMDMGSAELRILEELCVKRPKLALLTLMYSGKPEKQPSSGAERKDEMRHIKLRVDGDSPCARAGREAVGTYAGRIRSSSSQLANELEIKMDKERALVREEKEKARKEEEARYHPNFVDRLQDIVWIQSNGAPILIKDMDDTHLRNTISIIKDGIIKVRKGLARELAHEANRRRIWT